MKKFILTQLTEIEAEDIKIKVAKAETYRTLLENQFINDKEKVIIYKMHQQAINDVKMNYNDLLKKYNLPYVKDQQYMISEENELYIKLFYGN